MRQRISPATAISLVALFFSLTGAGMAATGYRITSIFQISPQVRHQLRAATGARGPAGAPGAPGVQGVQGPAGTPGAPGIIDWTKTYQVTASASVDTTNQVATLTAHCDNADHALTGGIVQAENVTLDNNTISADGPSYPTAGNHIRFDWDQWAARAVLADGASSGSISAVVVCVRSS